MLMALGLLYSLFLLASTILAAVVVGVAIVMLFLRPVRWIGIGTVLGGSIGAVAAATGFGVLMILLGDSIRDVSREMFLLWAVARFAWAGAGVAVICGGGAAALQIGRRIVLGLTRKRLT